MSTASLPQGKQILDLFSAATSAQAQRIIENGDLIRLLLEGDLRAVDREAFMALLNRNPLDRFNDKILSVSDWLALLREYNETYWNNKYTDEDFARAEALLANVPADHSQSVDNCFGYHVAGESYQETFDMWYPVYQGKLPNAWRWDGLKFGKKNFRLHALAHSYTPGIHLVNLNLVAHWEPETGRSIEQVRVQANEQCEVLAQLEPVSFYGALTDLFQEQNGTDLPYVDLAGIEVMAPGLAAWRLAMYFRWSRGARRALFFARDVGGSDRHYAAPVVQGVWS